MSNPTNKSYLLTQFKNFKTKIIDPLFFRKKDFYETTEAELDSVVSLAEVGDLIITTDGVIPEGGTEIDDTTISTDSVWSSNKTNTELNNKVNITDYPQDIGKYAIKRDYEQVQMASLDNVNVTCGTEYDNDILVFGVDNSENNVSYIYNEYQNTWTLFSNIPICPTHALYEYPDIHIFSSNAHYVYNTQLDNSNWIEDSNYPTNITNLYTVYVYARDWKIYLIGSDSNGESLMYSLRDDLWVSLEIEDAPFNYSYAKIADAGYAMPYAIVNDGQCKVYQLTLNDNKYSWGYICDFDMLMDIGYQISGFFYHNNPSGLCVVGANGDGYIADGDYNWEYFNGLNSLSFDSCLFVPKNFAETYAIGGNDNINVKLGVVDYYSNSLKWHTHIDGSDLIYTYETIEAKDIKYEYSNVESELSNIYRKYDVDAKLYTKVNNPSVSVTSGRVATSDGAGGVSWLDPQAGGHEMLPDPSDEPTQEEVIEAISAVSADSDNENVVSAYSVANWSNGLEKTHIMKNIPANKNEVGTWQTGDKSSWVTTSWWFIPDLLGVTSNDNIDIVIGYNPAREEPISVIGYQLNDDDTRTINGQTVHGGSICIKIGAHKNICDLTVTLTKKHTEVTSYNYSELYP